MAPLVKKPSSPFVVPMRVMVPVPSELMVLSSTSIPSRVSPTPVTKMVADPVELMVASSMRAPWSPVPERETFPSMERMELLSMLMPLSPAPFPLIVIVAADAPIPVDTTDDPLCISKPFSALVLVAVIRISPSTLVMIEPTLVLSSSMSMPSESLPARAVPVSVMVPIPVERIVDPSM